MTVRHLSILATFLFSLAFATTSLADLPTTRDDGVTVIHLDEYNGYFSAVETLASLQVGDYEFVVTNRADKVVGFQIQNLKSHETLKKFGLQPGETKIAKITIGSDGVRFRCPINPTPWYELDSFRVN
ncbi:MAG: hypothetical protein DHS20C11_36610 [Lysobacteraceae bacterium]|nr:MAG: hypothetical protein DHS20C11_36610 [Xanthomonadaceae bacterium]